jgi:hypothetical protein
VETCIDCAVPLVHTASQTGGAETLDAPEWTELAVVTDPHEAELMRGYLESEGIACNLESLVFNAEPFTFGPLSKVRIHVLESDEARARELLAALEQVPAAVDELA